MVQILYHSLSDDPHNFLLCHWLDIRSLGTLDIAISSNVSRPYWMALLQCMRAEAIDDMHHSASWLMWLIERGICPSKVQMKVNAWWVPGCDLSLLNKRNLLHLGLKRCSVVMDECILWALNRCSNTRRGHLGRYNKLQDVSVLALGNGYAQLQSINLEGCREVTDVCVSALGHGCGQLQIIKLSGCFQVTDVGISALPSTVNSHQDVAMVSCSENVMH